MAAFQRTLTLNGTAQRLSQVYASGAANAEPSADQNIPFRQLWLQADPANANVVYLGADALVTSINHGVSLDPTQATAQDRVSMGPFSSGPVKLSDFWAIGTNAQRLMILGIPF